MKIALAAVLVLGVFLAVSGCATTRYEEYVPGGGMSETSGSEESAAPSAGTEAGEKSADGEARPTDVGTLLSLEERISRLEVDLARRRDDERAATGELATQMRSLTEQLTEMRRRLETIRDLSEGKSPAAPAPVRGGGNRSLAAARNPGHAYELALSAFNDNDYVTAQSRFQEVHDLAPSGDLADNAQYWIGECLYARGAWGAAIESFRKVFHFNTTEKDDDAQFKLGLCYLKLGQREHALIEFRRLTVDYPTSEYAARAEAHIRDLRAQLGSEP